MKKVFTLSTCDNSRRILKQTNITKLGFEIKDIKTSSITATELEEMQGLAGSYEALFSRRSQKYKSMGLKDVELEEEDFKKLILQEYTFLKRPVIIDGNQIFIGNSKTNVEALLKHLDIT
jgi:arsenate reductase